MPEIEGLREALEALPLRIDRVRVFPGAVALRGYVEGPRPTSTVILDGDGMSGHGEHVGWTQAAHQAFRTAAGSVAHGTWTVGAWASRLLDLEPYDRAALEAAAIDLALRQQGATLLGLAGAVPRDVRYVVSFARSDDPIREAGAAGGVELKVDADPDWLRTGWQRLADLGRVAVVDFKLGGEASQHELACEMLPDAWIEDPKPSTARWSPRLLTRLSADAEVTGVRALAALDPRPSAVNVKAPRVGGVLEAVSCLAWCAKRGIPTYVGGMFEVGVARRQSLVLASIACADGPNDIAPLAGSEADTTARPSHLLADAAWPGFAGDVPPGDESPRDESQ